MWAQAPWGCPRKPWSNMVCDRPSHYSMRLLSLSLSLSLSEYLVGAVRLVEDRHRYPTRNKKNLEIKPTRSRTAEKSIVYRGFQMFNNLSGEIKMSATLRAFKRSLVAHLRATTWRAGGEWKTGGWSCGHEITNREQIFEVKLILRTDDL